jgi:hypothetical protein
MPIKSEEALAAADPKRNKTSEAGSWLQAKATGARKTNAATSSGSLFRELLLSLLDCNFGLLHFFLTWGGYVLSRTIFLVSAAHPVGRRSRKLDISV